MLRKKYEIYEENLEPYEFDLGNGVKGPLDVLLEMLEEEQVEIQDIALSHITEQYIEYVKTLDSLDLDHVSSFIYYASLLLDLKVKYLMGGGDQDTIEPIDDEEEDLRSKLTRLKLLMDMRAQLENRQVVYRYFIEPEFSESDCRYCINNFNVEALADAYYQVRLRQEIRQVAKKPAAKTVVKDRFTVLDKTKELVILLKEQKEISFNSIAMDKSDLTNSEKINTFLALLELLKRHFAVAEQDKPFDDIIIKLAEGKDEITLEDILKGDYADYEFKPEEDKK